MKRRNERGFSVIELTIGAMLTVGMMGVIFSLVNRNQQVFLSESGTTDMNENIRTAVDLITRDVQSCRDGASTSKRQLCGYLLRQRSKRRIRFDHDRQRRPLCS